MDYFPDRYVEAYKLAKEQGQLDKVAKLSACSKKQLSRFLSERQCAGHERSTKILRAFIHCGILNKHTPIHALFPQHDTLYVKHRKSNGADGESAIKIHGPVECSYLADLWVEWIKDEKNHLTVQILRDLMGRSKNVTTIRQCDLAIGRATLIPRDTTGIGAVTDQWSAGLQKTA